MFKIGEFYNVNVKIGGGNHLKTYSEFLGFKYDFNLNEELYLFKTIYNNEMELTLDEFKIGGNIDES